MSTDERVLIWSEEHGAWWRWSQQGYTHSMAQAGRYPRAEAESIVRDANFSTVFHEVIVPIPDGLDELIKRVTG